MSAPLAMLGLLGLLQQVTQHGPSMFAARGPAASMIAAIGWTLIVIGTLVFLIVMALLLYPLWRSRRTSGTDEAPPSDPVEVSEGGWILFGGAAVPALILLGVFVLTLGSLHALEAPPKAAHAIRVEVVGHQWWWEIRYPQYGITTANEIHIPVGRPVMIALETKDVIHSFWVPQLNGKTDLVPLMPNGTWLQADTAGLYRGECAEYCGMQHAKMAFTVVAEDMGTFQRWLRTEHDDAKPPADSTIAIGQQVFMQQSCSYCHTIRGTPANGKVGPDLTHIGSRHTLAAGTLDNTRGNLGGWITNADELKPGAKMPPVPLDGPSLQALIAYLESLK